MSKPFNIHVHCTVSYVNITFLLCIKELLLVITFQERICFGSGLPPPASLMDWSYLSGGDYKRTRFRLTSGGEEGGRIIAQVTGVKQICLPNVICSFGAFTIWS